MKGRKEIKQAWQKNIFIIVTEEKWGRDNHASLGIQELGTEESWKPYKGV